MIRVFIGVTLLTTAVLAVVLLGAIHPRLRQFTDLSVALRSAHQGMLAQEDNLRGWLSSGDRAYLANYEQARDLTGQANDRLVAELEGDTTIAEGVLGLHLAQQAWADEWAGRARTDAAATLRGPELDAFLLEGAALFDRYREAQDDITADVVRRREDALGDERNTLFLGMGAEVAACVALFLVARRQRRRLERTLLPPLADLVDTMERVRDGDLSARADDSGPSEVRRVGAGLSDMTSALAAQQEVAARREDEAAESRVRLQRVLDLAREVAGSHSAGHVASAVAAVAREVSGCRAVTVWLLDEDGTLHALLDSAEPAGQAPTRVPVPLGAGASGEAARDARSVVVEQDGEVIQALPLVVGARIIGVLELMGGDRAGQSEGDELEALAIHAAAALEASRLHEQARELSAHDTLTGLYNRRRLDADLVTEVERSVRYGRPLAFALLDLDNFKQVNDSWGHQHGDEVLRQVANTLASVVRSSDTVYRYGGEEFAVLVREGTSASAVELAERLRKSLEAVVLTDEGMSLVTASLGVAALGPEVTDAESLLAAADTALYAAKAKGRNRVEPYRPGQPEASALQRVR